MLRGNFLLSAMLAVFVGGCALDAGPDFPDPSDPEEGFEEPDDVPGDPEESPVTFDELDEDTTFYASYTSTITCEKPPFGDNGGGYTTVALRYSYHWVNFFGTQVRAARLDSMNYTIRNHFTLKGGGNNKLGLRWQYKVDGQWKDVYSVSDGWAWYGNKLGEPSSKYASIGQSAILWNIPIRVKIRTSWDTFGSDPSKHCYLYFRK